MARTPVLRRPRPHRRPLAPLAATALALAAGLAAAAVPAAAATAPPVITISPTTTGTSLTGASAGLSFEASDLALPGFTGGDLASYLDAISPSSVLRIGGNTVDETFWTSTGEPAPSWAIATITPADLTALAGLARASGWKVILGVNLKQYDPARAAGEAQDAQAALGSYLQAIEIGNEPDLYAQYESDPSAYLTDFASYVSAIRQAAPGVPIEGTDAAGAPDGSFQQAFTAQQQALTAPQVNELTSHYYPLVSSTCGGSPTIAQLLGTTVRNNEKSEADEAVAAAAPLGVPAVIDEGNSVVCEGQQGVSDVFASALWELDDQLVMAREGVAGDYMHGTVVQCDSAKPLFMYYTPLCAPTAADAAAGDLAAQPEYYGLAALRDVGAGQFLNLSNPVWADVRAYAVLHANGTMTVVLDNVDDPSATGATTVQLDLGASYGWASQVNLSGAGGLTATSGITLGGQAVSASGTLPAPAPAGFDVGGDTVTVTVPAGTAQILTFSSAATEGTTLVGGLSGKCLSVSGGSATAGAAADIYTCNGSGSENWTLGSDGEIVGGPSGDCLQVAGGSTSSYAGVDIEPCDGSAGQRWTVTPSGTIVGVQSGLCLSVLGASTANYATADLYTCNGSGSESWSQRPAS
ncbi:MAG TPA: glycosyl hydrolase family protein [Trebonia sp.]|nr:glycosyl hydrolase family protein [Trebonia sp.]